jgi:hypothetical protein
MYLLLAELLKELLTGETLLWSIFQCDRAWTSRNEAKSLEVL